MMMLSIEVSGFLSGFFMRGGGGVQKDPLNILGGGEALLMTVYSTGKIFSPWQTHGYSF